VLLPLSYFLKSLIVLVLALLLNHWEYTGKVFWARIAYDILVLGPIIAYLHFGAKAQGAIKSVIDGALLFLQEMVLYLSVVRLS